MRLKKLQLRDFRGFESLDLDLEDDVTVLVGVNGAGKTSILDALAMMVSHYTAGALGEGAAPVELTERDVRVGASTGSVELSASIYTDDTTWRVTRTRRGHPPGEPSSVGALAAVVAETQRQIASDTASLPLAVYLPTGRNVLDIPDRIRTPHTFDQLAAWEGALQGGEQNFRVFFEWFREEQDIFFAEEAQNPQTTWLPASSERRPSPLPAVREAILSLVPQATAIRIERRVQRMKLMIGGIELEVAQLSDGEKGLLALAGDLARRMALAAPRSEKPLEEPAVVLIDEIELHLHPGLQRTILPTLRRVFPNTQLVVTTHSPQVLSSVRASNVRLLEKFAIRNLDRETWRRDTNRILQGVFGDPGRPPEVAKKLDELQVAVDDDRFAEAWRLVHELQATVGKDEPDVFYFAQLLPPEESVDGAGPNA